jgi:O-methyltransferase
VKEWLKRFLASHDRIIVRISNHHVAPKTDFDLVPKGKCHEAVRGLYELMDEFLLDSLPPMTDTRLDTLSSLIGLTPPQGVYLMDLLAKTAHLNGAVCEMGVAQGRTSVLIAQEIAETSRELWLFDSFQGLPEPTPEDELIDDLFSLGSMSAYAGTMMAPRALVEHALERCGFPPERVHIVEGYFDETTASRVPLPDSVSFAFVDFDLYKPIRDALEYLDCVLQDGGCIAVHDYGYFSAGAQKAVDEFVSSRRGGYDLARPHAVAGGMAILTRTRVSEHSEA